MERKDFARMTKNIKDSVEKAMDSIPYEKVGKKMYQGVERAGQEVEKAGQRIKEGYETERQQRSRVKPPKGRRKKGKETEVEHTGFFRKFWEKRKESGEYREAEIFAPKPKGRFVGSLSLFLGILLSGTAGIASLIHWYTSIMYGGSFFSGKTIGVLLLFGFGVIMTVRGNAIKGRLRRFQMYKRRLLGKEYCQLELLGKTTGKSVRYLKKDLKKMIECGMFLQGHLDEQGTCLMLTNRAYQQYMMMLEAKMKQKKEEKVAAMQKEEEERKKEEIKNQRFADVEEELREEIKKIVRDGEVYLDRFKAVNDRLEGEGITKKLSRLSVVTERIFGFIMEHPKKLGDIRKFMSYYLPTTEKLLATYEELDRELVQGENIMKAKKEIEDTLDTINFAFENLLDSLYEDTMMDISTDIAVLETMLAQEGLTEQDF